MRSASTPSPHRLMFGLFNERRAVFFLYVLAILFLGYRVQRADFLQMGMGFGTAFFAYFHWIERGSYDRPRRLMMDALIIRLLLLVALPRLSDDFFRFIWDGQLQVMGMDPFLSLPSDLSMDSEYMRSIFAGLNSPDYYSVYPPVMQWVFHGAALIGEESTLVQLLLMRTLLIAADMGVIWLGIKILMLLKRSTSVMALYAFNPLVVVELVGNLHFEGLMLFFSLAGIYLVMKSTEYRAGVLGGLVFGLGVITKLTNLLFLVPMLRRSGLARSLTFGLAALTMVALGFWPFISDELLANFGSSLDLYFRNFEFNASVYSLAMTVVGEYVPHYTARTVGPIMMACTLIGILVVALGRRSESWKDYFVTLLFVMGIHLLFASTVHPWYVINVLLVSVFTRYRFVMVWSFMVVFSYFMYGNDLYQPWWLTALEYGVVIAYFIWELRGENSSTARRSRAG